MLHGNTGWALLFSLIHRLKVLHIPSQYQSLCPTECGPLVTYRYKSPYVHSQYVSVLDDPHVSPSPSLSAHGAHHRHCGPTRCPFPRLLQVGSSSLPLFSSCAHLANFALRHARSSEILSVRHLLCSMHLRSLNAGCATDRRVLSPQ